jgi:TIR domain-containing protein
MAKIFISYRREDSSGHARALSDVLERHFGPESVFFDVDDLAPGADFPLAIRNELKKCKVLLALIGKSWLTARDADGFRRIDNPDDFVRREVGSALARRVPVIPITLQDEKPPAPETLPKALKPLARRQAFALRNDRWETDVSLLIEQIEAILKPKSVRHILADFPRTSLADWNTGWRFSICLFIAAVLVATGGYVLVSDIPLPYQYSTLPTLGGVACVAGVVHGYQRTTSPAWDFVLAASIAVAVMLAISAVNYVPGEVDYWPRSDISWMIVKQFAATLFCGFIVGSLATRFVRGRWTG